MCRLRNTGGKEDIYCLPVCSLVKSKYPGSRHFMEILCTYVVMLHMNMSLQRIIMLSQSVCVDSLKGWTMATRLLHSLATFCAVCLVLNMHPVVLSRESKTTKVLVQWWVLFHTIYISVIERIPKQWGAVPLSSFLTFLVGVKSLTHNLTDSRMCDAI